MNAARCQSKDIITPRGDGTDKTWVIATWLATESANWLARKPHSGPSLSAGSAAQGPWRSGSRWSSWWRVTCKVTEHTSATSCHLMSPHSPHVTSHHPEKGEIFLETDHIHMTLIIVYCYKLFYFVIVILSLYQLDFYQRHVWIRKHSTCGVWHYLWFRASTGASGWMPQGCPVVSYCDPCWVFWLSSTLADMLFKVYKANNFKHLEFFHSFLQLLKHFLVTHAHFHSSFQDFLGNYMSVPFLLWITCN